VQCSVLLFHSSWICDDKDRETDKTTNETTSSFFVYVIFNRTKTIKPNSKTSSFGALLFLNYCCFSAQRCSSSTNMKLWTFDHNTLFLSFIFFFLFLSPFLKNIFVVFCFSRRLFSFPSPPPPPSSWTRVWAKSVGYCTGTRDRSTLVIVETSSNPIPKSQ